MRGAAVAIVAAATLTAAAAYGYWAVRSTTVRDHPDATATPTRKAPHLPRPSFLIPSPSPSQMRRSATLNLSTLRWSPKAIRVIAGQEGVRVPP
ncbi:Uncharacterised protein [Mycobacteroides abscessus subsp. massiliense]|nr:Uncharacterised protein [Mycobacteroides abscessus subsp. massiliense]SKD90586.1 Uncharacterised protein [Mycobacteroides abscessus subsp. massiliense]SKE02907.1 Uncharacterised protein [Mycobacteroides abscessus subsp. massiliense]SKE06997.1 Uncharacterised protein [Mycobacteroides abscessus subsp. massiliense]SKE21660.1 Uncharacterised protein [Mycobacteroides abscessus subsp. massiliense]